MIGQRCAQKLVNLGMVWLRVDVGGSGRIFGAGGSGGRGHQEEEVTVGRIGWKW